MRQKKTSMIGRITRGLIGRLSNDRFVGGLIKNGVLLGKIKEKKWKVPEHYRVFEIQGKRCTMEMTEPEQPNDDYILLQLHGGAYVFPMRNAYRSFAALYSELGQGIRVLTVDYRTAPEYPFPAALEDAVNAWDWLIDSGWSADRIIVAGDSAGGGLALSLCHWLKKEGRELPRGVIAMSPWTDMTASGASYAENYHRDPLFGNTSKSMISNRDYAGGHDPKDPLLSPVFGDFTGFPPMLIQVGSYEMLRDDSVLVAQKAKKQGVKVRLSVYEGMFHVFQMSKFLIPESRDAWKEIRQYLKIICNESEPSAKQLSVGSLFTE